MLLRNDHQNLQTVHAEKIELHRVQEQKENLHQQNLLLKHTE